MPWKNPDWWNTAFYALLSAAGGSLGYLFRQLTSNAKISWGRATIEGMGAGFVGFPVLWLCQAMGLSQQWTGVIVAVCGWLGATATIGIFQKIIEKKLGVNQP